MGDPVGPATAGPWDQAEALAGLLGVLPEESLEEPLPDPFEEPFDPAPFEVSEPPVDPLDESFDEVLDESFGGSEESEEPLVDPVDSVRRDFEEEPWSFL